jgi:hypothetical protein
MVYQVHCGSSIQCLNRLRQTVAQGQKQFSVFGWQKLPGASRRRTAPSGAAPPPLPTDEELIEKKTVSSYTK